MINANEIQPGDIIEWENWARQPISVTVTSVRRLPDGRPLTAFTSADGLYFEATCFKTFEEALAGKRISRP